MATLPGVDQSAALVLAIVVAVSAIGGLFPFSPIEPMLAVVATTRPGMALPVIVVAAVSQMSTKALLLIASQRAGAALPSRRRVTVERWCARLQGRVVLQRLAVLVSAFTGLPPFYALTVACGVMRVPMRDFLIAGVVGRALRFGAIMTLFGASTLGAQVQPAATASGTFVLISGMMGGTAGFRRLEAELARHGHQVISVDPFALSLDSADVSFSAMARRVEAVLATRGVTHARLVGHAHGAGVMLRLASAYPHRASALYFLDVGALPENRTQTLSRSVRLAPVIVRLPYGRELVRRKLVHGLTENSGSVAWLDDATQRAYTEPLLDQMPRVIAMAMRLARATEPEPLARVVGRIRIPTTVILGDAPRLSQPAASEIEALAPLGDLVRVERMTGVGHFLHEEAPAAVAAMLLSAPTVRARLAEARP